MFLNHLIRFPAVSVYLSLADALFVQIVFDLPLMVVCFQWRYFAIRQVIDFSVTCYAYVECRAEPSEFYFGVHYLVGFDVIIVRLFREARS